MAGGYVWLLLVTLLSEVNCASLGTADVYSDFGGTSLAALILIGSIICMVVLVVGCLDICRKNVTSFKDFDNDDSTDSPQPTVGDGFGMYPPVENTPDPITASSICFEPLPDVSKLRPHSSKTNASVMRPRVDVYTPVMKESNSTSLEMEQEEKQKLQNLITNKRHQLPRSQLQYIKELGTGYFGKVLQGEGQHILPGHKKTRVVIQMLGEEAAPWEQLAFLQEALPYREIDHPNIIKILGQCVESTPFLIVLELCPFGDLKSYLQNHRVAMETLNEKNLLLKFASDMIAGLQVLHNNNFVHHDFATRNCLLTADLTVKIGDYGLSEENYKDDYYFDSNDDPIPIRWMAPELINIGKDGTISINTFTKEANMWAYGIALWEVVQFGGMPYHDLNNDHVLRLVIKEQSIKLPKPELPINHIDRLYELMRLCWHEPQCRASPRELRIMILHLLSLKPTANVANVNQDPGAAVDMEAFDRKWNQLMPRKTAPDQQMPISTVSKGTEEILSANTSNLTNGGVRTSADSDLLELDVSTLSGDSLPKNDTPVNELSLEAELSAMNKTDSSDSMDEFVSADVTEEEETRTVDPMTDLHNISNIAKQDAIDSFDSDNATIIPEGKNTQGGTAVPDIVAISSLPHISKDPSPDFVTSTPKKPEDKNNETEQISSGETLYLTAASHMTSNTTSTTQPLARTPSTPRSSVEDGSLLGQKTFAAMLQTVASPSFDIDDTEFGSFTSSNGFDKSLGDVIEDDGEVMATPYQQEGEETFVEDGSKEGEEKVVGSGDRSDKSVDSKETLTNDNDTDLTENQQIGGEHTGSIDVAESQNDNSQSRNVTDPITDSAQNVKLADITASDVIHNMGDAKDNTGNEIKADNVTDDNKIADGNIDKADQSNVADSLTDNTGNAKVADNVKANTDDSNIADSMIVNTDNSNLADSLTDHTDQIKVADSSSDNTDDTQIADSVIDSTGDFKVANSVTDNAENSKLADSVADKGSDSRTENSDSFDVIGTAGDNKEDCSPETVDV